MAAPLVAGPGVRAQRRTLTSRRDWITSQTTTSCTRLKPCQNSSLTVHVWEVKPDYVIGHIVSQGLQPKLISHDCAFPPNMVLTG